MKIISVQFDYQNQDKYDRLAKVLEYSIQKNCPDANFELIKIPPPEITKRNKSKSFASNTIKLKYWLDALKETTEDVIFIDCDMIVLNDLSSAFNDTFDIGYTKRTKASMPYNGGVVFVKNNQNALDFISLWLDINNKMYNDSKFHAIWRHKYAGMNQAAFGYILEKENYKAKLKEFPCAVWNACGEDWPRIDDNTKVVHIKGGLRRSVLSPMALSMSRHRRPEILWNNLAIEANVINGRKYVIESTAKEPLPPQITRGLRRRRRR